MHAGGRRAIHYVGYLGSLAAGFPCMLRAARAHHAAAGRADVVRALDKALDASSLASFSEWLKPSHAENVAGRHLGDSKHQAQAKAIKEALALQRRAGWRLPLARSSARRQDELVESAYSFDVCLAEHGRN